MKIFQRVILIFWSTLWSTPRSTPWSTLWRTPRPALLPLFTGLFALESFGMNSSARASDFESAFESAFESNLKSNFESISINPELSLSFPQPIQIGAMVTCEGESFLCKDSLEFFVIGGYLPLSLGSRSVHLWNAELGARAFPFNFPLYFSLGVGYRSVSYNVNISSFQLADSTVATNAALNFSSFYAEPSVGWEFSLCDHLSLSLQLGLQIPFLPGGNLDLYNTQTGTNSNNSGELTVDNANYLSRIGNIPLPTFQVRLTWYW